jgi:hypothetical protein
MNKLITLVALSSLYSFSLIAKDTHLECIDNKNQEEIYIKLKESFFSAFDYCYSDKKRGVSPENNYSHEIYELDGNTLWMMVKRYPEVVTAQMFDYVSIMKANIESNDATNISLVITDKNEAIVTCNVISKKSAQTKSPCADF